MGPMVEDARRCEGQSICEWFPLMCLDARASIDASLSIDDWFPLTCWMRAPQAWAARSLIGSLLRLDARAAGVSVGKMRALLGVAAGSRRSLRYRWWYSELEWGRRSGQYRIDYTGYIVI